MRWTLLLIGLGLSGCIGDPPAKTAWEHYDECAAEVSSFLRMASCGKARRTAWCEKDKRCGAEGNAIVAYVDSLASSIERHEMTEPEAQRRWIEFRSSQVAAVRQLDAQRRSAMPVTCTTAGTITTCN